jgi:hypothetical protein
MSRGVKERQGFGIKITEKYPQSSASVIFVSCEREAVPMCILIPITAVKRSTVARVNTLYRAALGRDVE